ncbi:MAG: hypothetical protein QME47_05325 [Candidatus Thermoplasmatota archaeon]|nr:hypothetical protein [Candidatus Thermoplasmatota archaeon]
MKYNYIGKPEKCPACGEPVKNPDLNYCLKCGEMFWSKGFTRRTKLIR